MDRRDAGRQLASRLEYLKSEQPVIVALPRGGVVVAAEIARALNSPLDVLVVRKLGVPWQPELALGAIAEGGLRVMNVPLVASLRLADEVIAEIEEREGEELRRRVRAFRKGRARVPVAGRTVVVVDDGVATGATASVAARALRASGASRLVLAVPLSSPEALRTLERHVDEIVCLEAPGSLAAIGQFYEDFEQVDSAEVVALLDEAAVRRVTPSPARPGAIPPTTPR